MNALTYLTRRCPRNCQYCDLKKDEFENELTLEQWVSVFNILEKLEVDFNLILGNETWLLGSDLYTLMQYNKIPYALYTTAPPSLFDKYHEAFFLGPIDNLSCGIDWSLDYLNYREGAMSDDEKKSKDGHRAISATREYYPHVDCQGTMTIHRENFWELPQLVRELPKSDLSLEST